MIFLEFTVLMDQVYYSLNANKSVIQAGEFCYESSFPSLFGGKKLFFPFIKNKFMPSENFLQCLYFLDIQVRLQFSGLENWLNLQLHKCLPYDNSQLLLLTNPESAILLSLSTL